MILSTHAMTEGLNIIVDLGASNLRIGMAGSCLHSPFRAYPTPKTKAEILESLCDSINDLVNTYNRPLLGLAVGCPGLVDASGYILKSLYLPLEGCDLKAHLSQRLNVKNTRVINDAKAQVLGFKNKYVSIVYIVLGTGVGGAIIDRGSLVLGAQCFAGEIGHIQVGDTGAQCACGKNGCLDAYASGRALTQKLGINWFTKELTPSATEALSTAGYYVGRAAAIGAVLLNPLAIIIAGHITTQPYFKDGFENGWQRKDWPNVTLEFHEHTWPLACRGLSFLLGEEKAND